MVDPETTFIRLNSQVKFDSSATTDSADAIVTSVTTALTNYNTNTLQTFNSQYRASAVSRLLDESNAAILNNTTTVKLSKFFTPVVGSTTSYNLSFNNALFNPESGYLAATGGIVTSSGFKVGTDTTSEFFFDDDGKGNLRRYSLVGTTRSYADSQAGTIDYASGVIKINNINITSISNVDDATSTQIRLVVTPNSNDIVPVRNQILELDLTNTTITATADTEASSGSTFSTSGSGSTASTTVSTSGGSSSY